jgi:hypothetical protein
MPAVEQLNGEPALDQTVSWLEPFTSTCVGRFVELPKSVTERQTRDA